MGVPCIARMCINWWVRLKYHQADSKDQTITWFSLPKETSVKPMSEDSHVTLYHDTVEPTFPVEEIFTKTIKVAPVSVYYETTKHTVFQDTSIEAALVTSSSKTFRTTHSFQETYIETSKAALLTSYYNAAKAA
ncbi:hypothetical protein OPT61_g7272 [Boeremia exigua]|uniref:Uncharacterized protein n=1 Tax=Boeremia exigua TaxID=749465 RepID=A0ACC2I4M0_9PLEO|nr:hypothetical protein OPT61_g7272 [Boeremia exigua]